MANAFDEFDAPSQGGNAFDEFDIGAPPRQKTSGIGRLAQDTAVTALKGAVQVPRMAVGIADIPTGGRVGKFLENEGGAVGFRPKQALEYLDTLYSPETQAAKQEVSQAQGFVDTAKALVRNPSVIATGIGESLAPMFAGGVLGRGAQMLAPRLIGPAGAAAIGEGAIMAGGAASDIREQSPGGYLTPTQSGLAAATGLLGGAIGRAGGAVANRFGIGDIDVAAARAMGAQPITQAVTAPPKNILRRGIEGAVIEGGLEEAPQSAMEQALQNVALGKPVAEGVPESTAQGLLLGAPMGFVGGMLPSRQQQAPPPPPQKPPAPTAAGPSIDSTPAPAELPQPAAQAAQPPVRLPETGPLSKTLNAGIDSGAVPPPVLEPRADALDPALREQMAMDAARKRQRADEMVMRQEVEPQQTEGQQAVEPVQPAPAADILDGDRPFKTIIAARKARKAREDAESLTPVKVDGGYVLRRPEGGPPDAAAIDTRDAGLPFADSRGSDLARPESAGEPEQLLQPASTVDRQGAPSEGTVAVRRDERDQALSLDQLKQRATDVGIDPYRIMDEVDAFSEDYEAQAARALTAAIEATQPAAQRRETPPAAAGREAPAVRLDPDQPVEVDQAQQQAQQETQDARPPQPAATPVQPLSASQADVAPARGANTPAARPDEPRPAAGADRPLDAAPQAPVPVEPVAREDRREPPSVPADQAARPGVEPVAAQPAQAAESEPDWMQALFGTPAEAPAPARAEPNAAPPAPILESGGATVSQAGVPSEPESVGAAPDPAKQWGSMTLRQRIATVAKAGQAVLPRQTWNSIPEQARQAISAAMPTPQAAPPATTAAPPVSAGGESVLSSAPSETGGAAPVPKLRDKIAERKAAAGERTAAPRQGKIGDKLASGEVVLTASGRATTPFPKVLVGSNRATTNTVRSADRWLLDNAAAEAKARGDDFNLRTFHADSQSKSIPQASKDAAEEYLFGQQPSVVPSILKPLSLSATPQAPAPAPETAQGAATPAGVAPTRAQFEGFDRVEVKTDAGWKQGVVKMAGSQEVTVRLDDGNDVTVPESSVVPVATAPTPEAAPVSAAPPGETNAQEIGIQKGVLGERLGGNARRQAAEAGGGNRLLAAARGSEVAGQVGIPSTEGGAAQVGGPGAVGAGQAATPTKNLRTVIQQRNAGKQANETPAQPIPGAVSGADVNMAAQNAAIHTDPGKPAEPVTPAVVTRAIAKAADNRDRKPSAMKTDLLRMVDEAIPRATHDGRRQVPLGEKARDDPAHYIRFKVPGDGTFTVMNAKDALTEFRDKVEKSPGFSDRKTPRPVSPRVKDIPSGKKYSTPDTTAFGVQGGSSSAESATRNMIDDGDPQAAVDYAAARGLVIADVLKGDKVRLPKVAGLTPTAEAVGEFEPEVAEASPAPSPAPAAQPVAEPPAQAQAPDAPAPAAQPEVDAAPAVQPVAEAPAPAPVAEEAQNDRDTFTLERINRATDQMEPVTFKRGEYVKVHMLAAGLPEDKQWTYGEIDGISQARRQFSVDGLWHDFGAAYKAERPAAPKKDAVPLSSVIDKVNAKNGVGLGPADAVSAIEAIKSTMRAIYDGAASVDDYKAAYRRARDAAAVKAELAKMTKEELIRTFGIMARPDEKKDGLIATAYKSILRGFALGKEFGPRHYMMTRGGLENYERQQAEALDAIVEAHTAEDLAQYAEQVKAEREERAAKRAARAQALENPQTMDEFRALIESHMREGKSYDEARMMLTPEQRAKADLLGATASRSARKDRAESDRTRVSVAGQTVDGNIIATKHTKKGHDLYVVQLAERVSREDYETLNDGAKRIGGYYSSYRGGGAIPGFQFTSREQAEAFVKLAQGDSAAAQDAAKERRDAYEDDRSQTAAERLTEMADRMEEAATESLNRERKANTARRARFAAAAEQGAREAMAMAKTMRNVAAALTDGRAQFLDRVRTRTQVELLQTYVANAKGSELRAKFPTYAEQEKRKGQPPTAETADYAEFPTYTAYRSDLASLGRQLLEVDGTKQMGQRILSAADDVTDAFTAWLKEPGNIFRVSAFSTKDGAERPAFRAKEFAERAIVRSGYRGKAIPWMVKRGEWTVIMSPSEAIARGIWKGDGDKRITLDASFGAELVEKMGRANRRGAKVSVPWQFERAYERRKALSRMGLETGAEFRSALREFIGLREQAAEADRIKALERAMVGKAKDGLDFFPTPEAVADEMVAAADIRPDMAVLEPSAGMGHIADRIRAAGAEPDVIEMASDRRELLQEKGYHLMPQYDFLQMEPRSFFTFGDLFRAPDGREGIMHGGQWGSGRASLHEINEDGTEGRMIGWYDRDELVGVRHRESDSGYDRIVMNPPFSDGRDIKHVRHAYKLLKPGGRIVAIMGESAFTNQNKRATEFREWLEALGGTEEKLPPGTFMDPNLPVNTGANARMVVIDKPTAAAGGDSNTAFSRAPLRGGVPMDDADAVVSEIREAMPHAPPILVHEKLAEAPRALRDIIKAERAEYDVEAAYHDGKIHVFPRNIASVERMRFVVGYHEVRHHGIRSMLGTNAMGPVLLSMWQTNPTLRQRAQAKIDGGLATSRVIAVEEALADMPVEEVAALNGFKRLIAAIRRWLRQTAIRLRRANLPTVAAAIDPARWTDNDVAAFVLAAERVSVDGAATFRSGGTVFQIESDPIIFFSPLYRSVVGAEQKQAAAAGWKAFLKGQIAKGAIKQDEVTWSGVEDWLDMQPGKVSREAVADYLRANGVRVTETVLGGDGDIDDPRSAAAQGFGNTKYGKYTLPGGANYREVLLTLPTGGPSTIEAMSDAELRALILRNDSNADVDSVERSDLLAMVGNMELGSADLAKLTGKNTAQYKSSHWDQPNVLAHIRVNDRTDADGKRVLFVEEIQSDWAQQGKREGIDLGVRVPTKAAQKEGYWEVTDQRGRFITNVSNFDIERSTAEQALAEAARRLQGGSAHSVARAGVPSAPFIDKTDKWVSLALKRVIKMAVDEGYDRVAFVTGEQSAERYDLSKQVKRVAWNEETGELTAMRVDNLTMDSIGTGVKAEKLVDYIGKDAAERLAKADKNDKGFRVIAGNDLKVGGEGMRAFYDKIVPSVAKDVLRKVGGGALTTTQIDVQGRASEGNGLRTKYRYEGPTFTSAEMVHSSMMAKIDNATLENQARDVANALRNRIPFAQAMEENGSIALAEKIGGKMIEREQVLSEQPAIDITPAIREKAAGGLPMFARPKETSAGVFNIQQVQSQIDAIRSTWANAPEVVVVTDMQDSAVPESVRRQEQTQRSGGATGEPLGFFAEGKVYIVASQMQSATDVAQTMLHEALGHYGLRGVFGQDLSSILDRIVRMNRAKVEAKAKAYGLDMADPRSARIAAEEVLSEMAQTRPDLGWVQRAIAAIRSWLRQHLPMLVQSELTDAEIIREYIEPARRFVEQGAKGQIENSGTFKATNQEARFSRSLTAQDLVPKAKDSIFDFNRLGPTKQDRIRTVINSARKFWLGALTRHQIADVYGEDISEVIQYDKMARLMENERSKIAQDASAIYERWARLDSKVSRLLADIMADATLYSVHPDGDFAPGVGSMPEVERQAAHARISGDFQRLPAAARAVYRDVRTFHDSMLKQLREAVASRIMRQVPDGSARQATLNKLRLMFDKHLSEGPYFPLSRFGEYLVVASKDNGDRVVASYASAGEQSAAARKLESEGYTVKMRTAKTYTREDGSATKFIGDVLQAIDGLDFSNADADSKAQLLDDVNQMFIRALPDLSYRKHFMHRKGTPGFSDDMMRGFASSAFHAASHIARLNYADQMATVLQNAADVVEQDVKGDYNTRTQVLNELAARQEAMLNPNTHPIAAMLNQLGFLMYLGLSPAAGVINLMQTPTVTLPYLGARYGWNKASAALAKATKDIMHAPVNWASGWNAAESLRLTPEERQFMSLMHDEGIIDLTQAHDLAAATELDTGNVARSKAAFATARAMKIVGWTFHVPEVMNRQATALSAYRLEMQRSGNASRAADAARTAVIGTHFDYSSSNRARYMQGNVARVALQFKQYAQNITYLLGRSLFLALSREQSPEVRRIATQQLIGTIGVTFTLSGALGLPAVGTIGPIIEALLSAIDDDEEEDVTNWKTDFRNMMSDALGKDLAEVVSHGAVRALLPWDISARTSMADMWWRSSDSEGENPREEFAGAMANILGPTAGTLLGMFTAADHFQRGNWVKGTEAILPKFARDIIKSIREGTEGVTTLAGEPLMDTNTGENIGRALGFTPSRVSEMYEGRAAVKNAETLIGERRSALIERAAKARINGEDAADIMAEIREWNRRNPQDRINAMQIAQSIRNRMMNRARREDGILLPRTKEHLRDIGRFASTQ